MFVGIDLAWSSSNASGLAVVDGDGALVESGTAVSDDEIDAWIRTFAARSSVVAVDAPLVVTNSSGQRECERLVSQAFGKYNASCHSSNTGLAHLQVLRGAELAVRHGWTVNRHTTGRLTNQHASRCTRTQPWSGSSSLAP